MRASQVAQTVKNLPANTGDLGSIPGLERSCGGEHGYSLQYPCLENPMDREAWATVQVVTKSQTEQISLSLLLSLLLALNKHTPF